MLDVSSPSIFSRFKYSKRVVKICCLLISLSRFEKFKNALHGTICILAFTPGRGIWIKLDTSCEEANIACASAREEVKSTYLAS